MVSFDLRLSTRTGLHPEGEADQFVSEFTGEILCQNDQGGEAVAGKITALRINAANAVDHGYPLFEVCDAHSQELHVLHALLYRPKTYGFRGSLVRRFEAFESDLLVIDYVILDPKWRGLKLGLLAVRRLVDLVGGGCGLVVSGILPVRNDAHHLLGVPKSWIPANHGKAARREAATKLRRYFRTMGFERLGRTAYYALPTALSTPTAEELLRSAKESK